MAAPHTGEGRSGELQAGEIASGELAHFCTRGPYRQDEPILKAQLCGQPMPQPQQSGACFDEADRQFGEN